MLRLTPQERLVVLFFLTIALFGMGVNFLAKKHPGFKQIVTFNQDLGKANLNHADQLTLEGLRGIGEKLAQRIIEYRNQNNGFKKIDELKNIKGMNRSRYEKLKDLVVIK